MFYRHLVYLRLTGFLFSIFKELNLIVFNLNLLKHLSSSNVFFLHFSLYLNQYPIFLSHDFSISIFSFIILIISDGLSHTESVVGPVVKISVKSSPLLELSIIATSVFTFKNTGVLFFIYFIFHHLTK